MDSYGTLQILVSLDRGRLFACRANVDAEPLSESLDDRQLGYASALNTRESRCADLRVLLDRSQRDAEFLAAALELRPELINADGHGHGDRLRLGCITDDMRVAQLTQMAASAKLYAVFLQCNVGADSATPEASAGTMAPTRPFH